MPDSTTHYVSRVVVEKVTKREVPARSREFGTSESPRIEREVIELASVTARNNSLAGLKAQLAEHLELIEDSN